jgi:hypothetical protein
VCGGDGRSDRELAQRLREGQAPNVKVYDKAAPPQRQAMVVAPQVQHSRGRAVPAPVR